jgi:Tol biopolymer transport system component
MEVSMKKLSFFLHFLIPSILTLLSCEKSILNDDETAADIVFISDRDGTSNVFVMDIDGSNQTRLNSIRASQPHFSADGKKIVFHSTIAEHWDIFVMNSNGNHLANLTNSDYNEILSPNFISSDQIIFTSNKNGNWQLFSMNFDGKYQLNLTPDEFNSYYPVFSPGKNQIVFQSDSEGNRDLFIMDSDGRNRKRITNSATVENLPTFTQDGQKLLYSLNSDSQIDICSINLDGTEFQNLTNDLDYRCGLPVVTNDGNHIVFIADKRRGENRDVDLYLMELDGTNKQTLIENFGTCWGPQIINGTDKIIFYSNQDGDWDIYSIDLQSREINALTNNSDNDLYAAVNPAL